MSTEIPNNTAEAVPVEASNVVQMPQGGMAKREPREVASFDAENPVAFYMNTALFEQVQRVATLMSRANLVPAHLRGPEKLSDCFLVVSQAFRWRMDPFAVAQHTYVLSGKLGYEGKLIAAVINSSGRLRENLAFEYSGAKGTIDRRVKVVGKLRGESTDRTIEGSVNDWKTSNQKWQEIPDQMLAYRGAREWARRHMPEAVLGVQSDDEIVDVDFERRPDPVEVAAPVTLTLDVAAEKLEAKAAAKAPESVTDGPTPLESEPAFLRAQARAKGGK